MMSFASTIIGSRRSNGSKRLATSSRIVRLDMATCASAGLYEKHETYPKPDFNGFLTDESLPSFIVTMLLRS